MVRPFAAFLGAALAVAAALSLGACDRPDASAEMARARVAARYDEGALAYAQYCALCHGPEADGYAADHAPSLKSPTFLESASDEYILRAIKEGRYGTAMAGYAKARGGPLDDEAIDEILTFVRAHGPPRLALGHGAVTGFPARGAEIYTANCQRCHGTKEQRGEAVHLANSGLLGSANDSFLRYAVEHGRPGTPMPSFQGVLSEDDIDNVVAYVRTWGGPRAPERGRGQIEPPPLGDDFIINPHGKNPEFVLKGDRYVPNAEVKKAIDAGERMVIIDARATSDWFGTRVPGSISVPYYGFDRLDAMPRDGTWILAYCACPHHASGVVVDELRKRGFKKTGILDEGIMAWKKSGYPLEGDTIDLAEQKKAAGIP